LSRVVLGTAESRALGAASQGVSSRQCLARLGRCNCGNWRRVRWEWRLWTRLTVL